jgi:hypothetical protein
MRNILFAGVALLGFCGAAHADDSLNDCVSSEAGRALLRQAIQAAQYDVTSKENVAMHVLNFSNDEYRVRTEDQQADDVIVRTARRLGSLNDSVTLSMAHAIGVDRFFYQDSLICLHNAHINAPVTHGGEVKVIVQPSPTWSTQPATISDPPYAEQVKISDRLHKSHGRPAHCYLEVNGHVYLNGICNFEALDKNGSFSIGAADAKPSKYFAYVNIVDGVATGSWNGEDASSHAHNDLGTLVRQNECRVNDHAKICAL